MLEHRRDALRLVSKIALGAAACVLGADALRTPSLDGIRAFIRDGTVSGDSPPAGRSLREKSSPPSPTIT